MALVCFCCGHDLNRELHAEDCTGGELHWVPYASAEDSARRERLALEEEARGEIPF